MATDKQIAVQLARADRHFIKVYTDFFKSNNLTANEKIVYIGLKSFLDYKADSGSVFPSIQTLCDMIGLNRKTVIKVLKSLEQKGAIKKQRRGLTKTNLYILNDNSNMWQADTVEQMKELSESPIDYSTDELIAELERRGAIKILNEESLKSYTDQSNDLKPSNNQLNIVKTTKNYNQSDSGCQSERFSIADIKEHYGYDILIERKPLAKDEIDGYINLLYDLLNTTKDYITISGERKPVSVVWSRLEKMYYEHILYVIEQYESVTERIYNQRAYKTKLLYEAYDQLHSDISNQVRYDMTHRDEDS